MTKDLTKAGNFNLNSKKGRQFALEAKILEIDERLKEIGVGLLKYKILSAIANPEATQNTIKISGIVDFSLLFRLLAHFQNIQKVKNEFCKVNSIELISPLVNINGISIHDIIDDIQVRIMYLKHQVEITNLITIKAKLTPFLNEESRFVSALKEVSALLKPQTK